MVLGSIFSPDCIKLNLEGEDKEEVFEELVDLYVSSAPSSSRAVILSAVRSREAKQSTGIRKGFALPHAQTEAVKGVKGIIGISRSGVEYDALDGKPVYIIFMMLSSAEGCSLHLRALKRLSLLLEDPEFYQTLISQTSSEGVYRTMCKYDDILATSM